MGIQAQAGAVGDVMGFTAVIRNELFAMRYDSDINARSAPSTLAGVQAGPLDVLRYRGRGEQWGGRDHGLIRADRADYYVVCAPISACLTIDQNGWHSALQPGQFTIVSTARPFTAHIRAESQRDAFSALHVRIPGALLRRRLPTLDEHCGQVINAAAGAPRLMLSLFDLMLEEAPYLPAAQVDGFASTLVEAIGNVAAALIECDALRGERLSSHARTYARAQAYIAAHLSDPSLSPARVAEHCGISTSYLHAAFAAQTSAPVAQLIRETRLQACREALQNPRLRQRTILEIAGDWGFDDPSHFSRLYKLRFGRTPREDRLQPVQQAVAAALH